MSRVYTYVPNNTGPEGPTPSDCFREWTEFLVHLENGDPENVLDVLGTFLARFRTYSRAQGYTWEAVQKRAHEVLIRFKTEKRAEADPCLSTNEPPHNTVVSVE